jgi:hypothetical protein
LRALEIAVCKAVALMLGGNVGNWEPRIVRLTPAAAAAAANTLLVMNKH